MNLRRRLVIVLTIGGLLPLLIALWAMGRWFETRLDQNSDAGLQGQAAIAARHLEVRIDGLLDQARTDSRIPEFRLALTRQAPGVNLQQLLTQVATKDVLNTVSCALLDAAGKVVADTQPQNLGADESRMPYLEALRTVALPRFDAPAVPPGLQRPYLHLVAPIGGDAAPVGFLRWRFEPALLQQVLYQDEQLAAGGVHYLLIDEARTVLAGHRDLAPRGSRLGLISREDLRGPGWTEGNTYRFASAQLASLPWSVIALQPRAEYTSGPQALRLVLGVVALSAAILVLMTAAIASARLSRPVRQLAAVVGAIDPSNPPTTLVGVEGEGEIKALAERFSDLLQRIRSLLDERQARLVELERAAAALQESETFHRGLFESSPNGLVVMEAGRVGDCNAKVLALFRCTRQQLEYRPPFQRLPERLDDGRSSSLAAEEILSAVESGAERQVRWPLVREDGSRFIADLVVKRLDLPAASVVLIVIRDVTQEIELEERLRQAQKLDAVGQLAGGVAHDFNNMLAGIIGSADLLKSRLASDDRAQRLVTTILTAGERAASLSRQLLTFTRQSRSVSTPVDVHQIITEALELFGRSVDRRITIDTNLSASPHLVMGDPSQLQNAVLNLCLNSRDAMPDGGRLELTTEVVVLERGFAANLGFELDAGSYLRLAITDTGVGMSPEVQARIFEPFFTTKEVGRGTGLGLSVVWGTVKDHRGAITIASRPGAGTTIHIYLPLVEQTRSDRNTAAPSAERGSGRILVVEDEDLVRSSTTLLLEDLGYEVISAKDGQQGVEVFEREHGSLFAVLLDAVMPRLGGRDTFRAMRAIDPSVPIILTSGFTRDLAVKDLRDQGLFAFLAKPFPRHELARVIAMAVETRRQRIPKGG